MEVHAGGRSRKIALRRGGGRLVSGVALAALLASACAGGEEGQPEPEVVQEEEVRDPDAPGLHRLGPNRYEVVVYAFEGGYDPAEVRIPAGAEVTFRTSSLDIPHGFFVQGPNLKLVTMPAEFGTVTHTFTAPGEYVFFCDEYCGGGHEMMRGRIVVE